MSVEQSSTLAKKTLRGLSWTYLTHYSGKLLVFISTVILARLLLKDDFGVAGYAIVVIGFLDVLNDLGIGPALIYYPPSEEAWDTGFWLGLGVSCVLFLCTWFAAPLVGAFFNDARAVPVVRILALTFPLTALSNIQETLLRKEMAFKRKFVPDTVRSVSKGTFSIVFALLGFGPWSLVIGQVLGTTISIIPYWSAVSWRPSFRFARHLVRPLLSYGTGIVVVNILGAVLMNIDYIFVGRFLGADALGTYMLAFRLPELVILQFCGIVTGKVFFPMYAAIRDDQQALNRVFLSATQYVALVTVPLGLGMALVAEPLVLTIFGEKWIDAVPIMQAIAIYALFLSLGYNIGDIYKAQGKTLVLTKLSVLRACMLIPALWWVTASVGTIAAVGWTQTIMAGVSCAINLFVAARLIQLPLSSILAVLRPAVVSGALMALAVVPLLRLCANAPVLVQLMVCVGAGVVVYIAALWWLQRDLVMQASTSLRTAFARR